MSTGFGKKLYKSMNEKTPACRLASEGQNVCPMNRKRLLVTGRIVHKISDNVDKSQRRFQHAALADIDGQRVFFKDFLSVV